MARSAAIGRVCVRVQKLHAAFDGISTVIPSPVKRDFPLFSPKNVPTIFALCPSIDRHPTRGRGRESARSVRRKRSCTRVTRSRDISDKSHGSGSLSLSLSIREENPFERSRYRTGKGYLLKIHRDTRIISPVVEERVEGQGRLQRIRRNKIIPWSVNYRVALYSMKAGPIHEDYRLVQRGKRSEGELRLGIDRDTSSKDISIVRSSPRQQSRP